MSKSERSPSARASRPPEPRRESGARRQSSVLFSPPAPRAKWGGLSPEDRQQTREAKPVDRQLVLKEIGFPDDVIRQVDPPHPPAKENTPLHSTTHPSPCLAHGDESGSRFAF